MKKRFLSLLLTLALLLTPCATAFAATLGDVTGDGEINLKDVTKLFQFVNKQIDTLGDADGDITGDGAVNLKDVTKLFQFVNKQIGSFDEDPPAPTATPKPTPEPSTDENGLDIAAAEANIEAYAQSLGFGIRGGLSGYDQEWYSGSSQSELEAEGRSLVNYCLETLQYAGKTGTMLMSCSIVQEGSRYHIYVYFYGHE